VTRMTRVPDHGMSRSRLLMNHDEFTIVAFSSVPLCNDVQSGILDMAYAMYTSVSLTDYVSCVLFS